MFVFIRKFRECLTFLIRSTTQKAQTVHQQLPEHNIRTPQKTGTILDYLPDIERCYVWTDEMIRTAQRFLDEGRTDPLLKNLFFLYSEHRHAIEFWISVCQSGCCCHATDGENSILLGSLQENRWSDHWPLIHGRLMVLSNNKREKRFYHCIKVLSHPSNPASTMDQTIVQHAIQWQLSERPLPSIAADPFAHLKTHAIQLPRRKGRETSYLRRVK